MGWGAFPQGFHPWLRSFTPLGWSGDFANEAFGEFAEAGGGLVEGGV